MSDDIVVYMMAEINRLQAELDARTQPSESALAAEEAACASYARALTALEDYVPIGTDAEFLRTDASVARDAWETTVAQCNREVARFVA